MHNRASKNTTLDNENIFSVPKLKQPANENSKQLRVHTFFYKQQHQLINSKTSLLSKRLEFILLKLKLQPEELIEFLEK
jgi:hypothetical protein